MRLTTPLLVVTLAAATVPLAAVSATADPKGETLDVTCDNGRTYTVTTNGNGEFTPAHDTSSTTVLVPTSFSGFSYTVTDADGNVVDSGSEDGVTYKGRSQRARGTSVTCTFSATETFMDPELGELTATFTGGVAGFTTPAR